MIADTLAREMTTQYTDQDIADILCTAIEGGISYWVHSGKAHRDDAGDYVWVRIVENGATAGTTCYHVDGAAIRRGIALIITGQVKIRSDIRAAVASGDAGNVDADAADCIVQAACFGDIVYG